MTRPRRPGSSRPPSPRRGRPATTAAGRPGAGAHPPPLEPRQARGLLVGLAVFATGFAVAGVLAAASLGGSPAYWIAISLGLLGVAVAGVLSPRGPLESARPAVWSRPGLAGVAGPLGLPGGLVAGIFYALLAVGVVGNVVLPLLLGRR